jgi:acyl-CoA hydrolase
MTVRLAPEALDLREFIRPGDALIWGQATGEPTTLVETLMAQRADLGGVSAFVGSSFSDSLDPEQADHVAFSSMGAIGSLSRLSKAGKLAIIPTHVGQIAPLIEAGAIGCDVAMLQVSPPGPDGQYSFGLINDYTRAMVAAARTVIVEVNHQIPFSCCDGLLGCEDIDVFVETDRAPIELKTGKPGETDRAIAAHISPYIDDGSVLQMGIGAVPDAVTRLITDRRDLGCHSGMIGDGIWHLMERGVLTNARKTGDAGVTVTGALIGSRGLYDFAHRNPMIAMRDSRATHGDAILTAIPRLVTINSAVEVDLTGQINAEQVGDFYLGATGGQVDYVRGGMRSPGGRSIVALPATAREGRSSRIVARLAGPVTTARSEADVIVTEFGAAELRGRSLADRAKAMVALAHPDFREELDRQAHAIAMRGF